MVPSPPYQEKFENFFLIGTGKILHEVYRQSMRQYLLRPSHSSLFDIGRTRTTTLTHSEFLEAAPRGFCTGIVGKNIVCPGPYSATSRRNLDSSVVVLEVMGVIDDY